MVAVFLFSSPIIIVYLNGGRLFVFFTYNYWEENKKTATIQKANNYR
jgi:hypothetical protein